MTRDIAEEVARKLLSGLVKDLTQLLACTSTGQIYLEINTNCGGVSKTYMGVRTEVKK
jgi:hypothetical protein